jgi:hypothetical protein
LLTFFGEAKKVSRMPGDSRPATLSRENWSAKA